MTPQAPTHQVQSFRSGVEDTLRRTFKGAFDLYFADGPKADRIGSAGNLGVAAVADLKSMAATFERRTDLMAQPAQPQSPPTGRRVAPGAQVDAPAAAAGQTVSGAQTADQGAAQSATADLVARTWAGQAQGAWAKAAGAKGETAFGDRQRGNRDRGSSQGF